MGIETIASKTPESIGLPVVDRPRALGRVPKYETSAEEWERFKDALIEGQTAIGLEDGTTTDSLEAMAHGLNAPSAGRAYYVGPGVGGAEDFFSKPASWTEDVASGTVTELLASNTDADTGSGWVKLTATGVGHTADYFSRHFVRGDHSPVFRARVKLSTTPANCDFVIGLYALDAPESYAVLEASGGFWNALAKSFNNAETVEFATTAVVPTAGWHDIRIEIDDGDEVRYYVDDALAHTFTGGGVPRTSDQFAVDFFVSRAAGAGGFMVVDWCEVRGTR